MLRLLKTAIFFVGLVVVFNFLVETANGMSPGYVNKAFREVAKEQGVDEKLLRAICWVESRHKPWQYRQADGGMGNHAFGLCQILYTTAKQFGVNDEKCLRDFSDFTPGERVYSACHLFGPKTNIRIAAKLIKYQLKKHNGDEYRAIMSYNAGSYRICRDGWLKANQIQDDGTVKRVRFKRCLKGGPINLYYAYKVLEAMDR